MSLFFCAGPVPGQRVVPELEDGTRGDQGKEAGGVFDSGGEFIHGLFFMGQEGGADTALCKIPAVALVFKPEEGDFGYRAGTGGEEEEVEPEQGKEQR